MPPGKIFFISLIEKGGTVHLGRKGEVEAKSFYREASRNSRTNNSKV